MGGKGSGKPPSTTPPKQYRPRYIERMADVGNKMPVHRLRRCYHGIVSDIGGEPSVLQSELAARAAFAVYWLGEIERRAMHGEPINLQEYEQHFGRLARTAALLGITRRARDAGTLRELIAEHSTSSSSSAREGDE